MPWQLLSTLRSQPPLLTYSSTLLLTPIILNDSITSYPSLWCSSGEICHVLDASKARLDASRASGVPRRSRTCLLPFLVPSSKPSCPPTAITKRAHAGPFSQADSMSSPRPGPQSIVSNSPGRPSPLSRPHWPWSTYSHRSSSSSVSFHSSSSPVPSTNAWDSRASTATSTPLLLSAGPSTASTRMASIQSHTAMADDVTTRQWNYNVSA